MLAILLAVTLPLLLLLVALLVGCWLLADRRRARMRRKGDFDLNFMTVHRNPRLHPHGASQVFVPFVATGSEAAGKLRPAPNHCFFKPEKKT